MLHQAHRWAFSADASAYLLMIEGEKHKMKVILLAKMQLREGQERKLVHCSSFHVCAEQVNHIYLP